MLLNSIALWDPFRDLALIEQELARSAARPVTAGPIELDVPGVKIDDIDITLEAGGLLVAWKDRHGSDRHARWRVGDVKGVDASLADGVLTISLERSAGRKIKIEKR